MAHMKISYYFAQIYHTLFADIHMTLADLQADDIIFLIFYSLLLTDINPYTPILLSTPTPNYYTLLFYLIRVHRCMLQLHQKICASPFAVIFIFLCILSLFMFPNLSSMPYMQIFLCFRGSNLHTYADLNQMLPIYKWTIFFSLF